MSTWWLVVLSLIQSTLLKISFVTGDGYDLKEMMSDKYPNDPITKDLAQLRLIEYMMSLENRAFGERFGTITKWFRGKYKTPPEKQSTFFIPRVSYTNQENAKECVLNI